MNRLVLVALVSLLSACAGIPQTPAQIEAAVQAQVTATCPTAQAEVSTLQSLSANLPQNVNLAVNNASPIIATICAPGFTVSSTTMATFLPAVTVIAVQYAANHQ